MFVPGLNNEIHVRASRVKDLRESSPRSDLIGESTGCGGQLFRSARLRPMAFGSRGLGEVYGRAIPSEINFRRESQV